MAATPPENRPPGAAPAAGTGVEPEHVSFVRRLRERFGKDLDPQINLQDPDVASGEAREDESGSDSSGSGSSTSRGLYEKLTSQPQAGPQYRVGQEIARGGMGIILRVWDDDLRRNLAMKVMTGAKSVGEDGSIHVDEEKLGRFLEEAQITGQLDHPGIVPVHNLGIDAKGRCYFTMRLVRGRELKEILDLTRNAQEGWTITRALGLILKVCEAMAFAHSKGVVHRDLKPSNVMVGRFGEVYVMDWGLARVLGRADSHVRAQANLEDGSAMSLVRTARRDESELNPDSPLVTMDGDVVGTPAFMAWEQAQGKLDEVGPRADVYSLGAILYYMLTGRSPYVKPKERVSPHTVLNRVLSGPPVPVSKYAKEAPAELVAICEKAMARRAEDRYGSMLEVADDIQAFLENRVVAAYGGGAVTEFRKWVARNKGMAVATAALVFFAIVSAFGFAWQKGKQVDALNTEKAETAAARDLAQQNAATAEKNLTLALERKAEADTNAQQAFDNAQLARRSGYMANVVAAAYSLRLHDVREARKRLEACDEELRGWEWHHLDLKAHPSIRAFGPEAQVDSVAFTPDGKRLLSLSNAGRLRAHDVRTGELVEPLDVVHLSFSTLSQRSRRVLDVSPDSTVFAMGGRDSHVRVYDLGTGEELFELPPTDDVLGHEEVTTAVAFDPSGRKVATASEDGTIIVWSVDDRSLLKHLPGHEAEVRALAWDPIGGSRLASASEDGTARIWNEETGQVDFVLRGHQGPVHGIAWKPDGHSVATCSADRAALLWDADSGRLDATLIGHREAVNSVAFHPTREELLTASDDRTLHIWDLTTREYEVLHGHDDGVLSAVYGSDGELILSCSRIRGSGGTGERGETLRLWDSRGDLSSIVLASAEASEALGGSSAVPGPGFPVGAVAYHPRGEYFAIGSDDASVTIWDADSEELLHVLRGHEARITSVAFSPDGESLLSGSFDTTARLWDVKTGRLIRKFEGHDKWINVVAFAPDGSWIVTGSGDTTLKIWDVATGAEMRTLEGHRGRNGKINDVAVHPSGELLASAAGDKRVLLWRLDQDEPVMTLTGHTRSVSAVAFSPDGKRLATGSLDQTAKVWDVETGEVVHAILGHDGQITDVTFSPDGMRLVTAAWDQTIRLWDVVSGESFLQLGGANIVDAVAFSPDGERILSAQNSEVRVYETQVDPERRQRRHDALRRWEAVAPLVDRLFDEHFYLTEVVLRLESEPSLGAAERETAIRMARARGDDASRLDRSNRAVVLFDGLDPGEYELTLRRARAACDIDNRNARLQCTLGMAQLRAERYPEAVASLALAAQTDKLDRSRRSDTPFSAGDTVLLLAYLSMAHAGAGQLEDAGTQLANARLQMRGHVDLSIRQEIAAAMDEAEARLEELTAD